MTIKTHPIIDFHGPSDKCSERLKALTAQGKASCAKSVDADGWAHQAAKIAKDSGVPHIVIFRQTKPGGLADDHPDLNIKDPRASAAKMWQAIKQTMPKQLEEVKDVIYIEPINEPGVVKEKPDQTHFIGQFCVEIAKMMLADGWNPALAGFNAGTPNQQEIRDHFVDLLRLFADNWHRCLWTLHEAKHGVPGHDWKSPQSLYVPHTINSSQLLFEVCDELGIRRPRTFISESAWSYDNIPGKDQFRAEVMELCNMDAQWPEVVGRVIWNTHSGPEWKNLRNKLNGHSAWLTQYVTTTTIETELAKPAPVLPTTGGVTANGGVVMTKGKDGAAAAGFLPGVDLDKVPAGSSFKATWIFKNTGTTTWNGRYQLAYTEQTHPETAAYTRTPLSNQTSFNLSEIASVTEVKPGATVQLSLNFKAPTKVDTYATNWRLQDANGKAFGPVRWLRAVVEKESSGGFIPPAGTFEYVTVNFENSAGDFNNLLPGREFAGIWTLQNSGTAPWAGEFQVTYSPQSTADTQGIISDLMGAKPTATLRELTGRDRINPGETVVLRFEFVAPKQAGAYAFHWQLKDGSGNPFGGTRWLKIGVNSSTQIVVPKEQRPFQPGMNLNPEVHDLDIERLRGLSWVRFPFFASRLKLSPEKAYHQRYRAIIQSYAAANIGTVLVLHQDTEWGNAPWDSGDWNTYANLFAQACGRVAKLCAEFGDRVAYQVFNEQDTDPSNPSAIPIAAHNFAPVLDKASAAIRANHPGAKVLIGGLNSGPDRAIKYVRDVRAAVGGRLPVDALACHPYGRFVKHDAFYNQKFGTLMAALDQFKAAFPDKPMWITEFGIPGHANVIGPEHYPAIAQYLSEVVEVVTDDYADYVPALIWFAWTDRMENAGVLTADGKEKPGLFDAFVEMREHGTAVAKAAAFGEVSEATYDSYSSTLTNLNAVPAGSEFSSSFYFKNSGTTTWDANYSLVYTPRGDNPATMMSKTRCSLSEVATNLPVAPGQRIEITLDMTAPEIFGRTYRSHWQLRDPQDVSFGFLFEELTVIPASTAGSNVRTVGMQFIADRTIADGTPLVAGGSFQKQWTVKNTGSRHWGTGFRLIFIQGDLQMAAGNPSHLVPAAKPGEEVVLSVAMSVPPAINGAPTAYSSLWRMQDDRGNVFGDPIWVKIVATTAVATTDDQTTPSNATALARLLNDPKMWYSQRDPRWQGEQLGNGAATIGSWGCLMTCMAMALTAFGTPVTPSELNQRLKAHGDFSGSSVDFSGPWDIGRLKYKGNVASWPNSNVPHAVWTGEDPIQRINSALAAGNIVITQVDTKPNNGLFDSNVEQHWVIIIKRAADGNDYLIIDPLTPPQHSQSQPISLMGKYGNAIPSKSGNENLRNAIKSTLVYHKPGGSGG